MKAKWTIISTVFALSITVFVALSGKQENPQATKRGNRSENQVEFGVIEGMVVDKNNQPLSRINVSARPKDPRLRGYRSTSTDRNGKFVINGIGYDITYLVHAGKDEEGYPSMVGIFHQNEDDFREVTVSKENKGITKIILGEKFGRISGTVKDDKGKPLSIATLRLTVSGNSSRFYGTTIEDDASFVVTVPPEPVILEVSADGYDTFKSESINVSRGAVKKLQIRLHRTAAR